MDVWQLPITETVGTCDLLLELSRFSLPEFSSWQEIKEVARHLDEKCRGKGALGDVTGGAASTGVHGRIQVSMVRSKGGVGEVADVA